VVATRAVPRASTLLPTLSLADVVGGPIPTTHSDSAGRTATEPRFAFELTLPEGTDARVGSRAMVTFWHGQASAAAWVERAGRQALLRHFVK